MSSAKWILPEAKLDSQQPLAIVIDQEGKCVSIAVLGFLLPFAFFYLQHLSRPLDSHARPGR